MVATRASCGTFGLKSSAGASRWLSGFVGRIVRRKQHREDALVADVLCKLATTFVVEASLGTLYFQTPPQCFVGVLADDEETRRAAIERLQVMWEALLALKAQATEDSESRGFIDYMMWPLQTGCREVFVMFQEHSFSSAPQGALEEICRFGGSHWSTLMAENLAKTRWAAAKTAPSWQFSCASFWHAMTRAPGGGSPTNRVFEATKSANKLSCGRIRDTGEIRSCGMLCSTVLVFVLPVRQSTIEERGS